MSFLTMLSSLQFEVINLIGAIIVLLIALPFLFKKQFAKGSTLKTKYSSIKNIKNVKPNLKVRLRNLPFYIRLLTILSLVVAFSHPWVEKINPPDDKKDKKEELKKDDPKKPERQKIQVPAEGISIQLLIDRSGSMGTFTMTDRSGKKVKINYVKYDNEIMSKLDVVKVISKQFIAGNENLKAENGFGGRWSDLIGLYTFARFPFVACPLTLRHDLLLNYISQLEVAKSQEEDGTYIGYGLERVVLQIIDTRSKAKEKNAYNIKSSVIVLITDGEQSIRPEDQSDRHKSMLPTDIAKIAKVNGIKIYSIVIKPQVIYDEQGTAYDPKAIFQSADFNTDEVREAAELTGGKCYIAKDGSGLLDIYKEIDKLEKSQLPSKKEIEVRVEKENKINKKEVEKIELFQPFLIFGLLLFMAEVLASSLYFRRIP